MTTLMTSKIKVDIKVKDPVCEHGARCFRSGTSKTKANVPWSAWFCRHSGPDKCQPIWLTNQSEWINGESSSVIDRDITCEHGGMRHITRTDGDGNMSERWYCVANKCPSFGY